MNDRRTTVELELRLPPGVTDKEVRRRLSRGFELRSKGDGQAEWLSCGVIASTLLGFDAEAARAAESAPAAPEEPFDDQGSLGSAPPPRRPAPAGRAAPAAPKPARKARRKAGRKSRR